jgi:predicted dehydrogenase
MIRLVVDRTEPLRAELLSFLQSVRDGTPPVVTGWHGLEALQVAEALLRSSETGSGTALVEPRERVAAGG